MSKDEVYNDESMGVRTKGVKLFKHRLHGMSSSNRSHDKVEIYELQSMCTISTKVLYFGQLSHYIFSRYSYCIQDGQELLDMNLTFGCKLDGMASTE